MELLPTLQRYRVMDMMSKTIARPPATWLRTDHPVIPINPSTWVHLPEVETALSKGVRATADSKHPGFYEIEVGDNWYYLHIPSRIQGVYLVAAEKGRALRESQAVAAHQCA